MTGEHGPQSFRWGDGPCIRPPPNILRSSVVGCARKYEKSKKNGVFIVRKRLCTISIKVKIPENEREERENLKKVVKKGHQKFVPLKWKFFLKKRHLGWRNFVPSPQTRRQVSATDYMHARTIHNVIAQEGRTKYKRVGRILSPTISKGQVPTQIFSKEKGA